jgi:hypothetical protein
MDEEACGIDGGRARTRREEGEINGGREDNIGLHMDGRREEEDLGSSHWAEGSEGGLRLEASDEDGVGG